MFSTRSFLKIALPGAVYVQTDADWGGDPDRKSTSGVIVWEKAANGKWYMVQSLSRKQTTVALSTAEAGLIAMLAGVCEMCGISQLWRWMLAEGIIEDMKQMDEIVGSDSSAGISILKSHHEGAGGADGGPAQHSHG